MAYVMTHGNDQGPIAWATPGHVGVTARNNPIWAVLYRYRAGIAWRDLPQRGGSYEISRCLGEVVQGFS
jgi:hypothetical protein